MKASGFFGGQYLSVADLDGQPVTSTIQDITSEVVSNRDGADRERIILHLDKLQKPCIVNATNGDKLIEAFGDETDLWLGKQVTVSRGKVLFAGKRIDSVVINPVK